MKKWIALLLALVLVMSAFAGCGKENTADTAETSEVTEATGAVAVPASALEILENIWALYGEDEKFPAMGGDMNNMVDGAPGNFAVTDGEALAYYFYLSEDQIASIDDAASLLHGMMLNNFTCGVFHVTADADSFAAQLHDALANNQWLCGMPDQQLIAIIGGEYVLMAFGIQDAIGPFEGKLMEAYPDADVKYSENLA